MIYQHAALAVRAGLRSRAFHAMLLLGLLMLAVAWLAAAFSARQPQTVAMDVGLSATRLSLTLLSLIWVQELIGKEIERRSVFFVLAYPQSRAHYLIGRYLGILTLVLLAGLLFGVLLYAVVSVSGWGYQYPHEMHLPWPYVATISMMMLDLALVLSMAVCIATLATSSVFSVLVGLAFAIAARMLGPVFSYLSAGADGDKELVANFSHTVSLLTWLLPDLDRLDLRMWPLYGLPPDWSLIGTVALSVVTYALFLLLIACAIFRKRAFV